MVLKMDEESYGIYFFFVMCLLVIVVRPFICFQRSSSFLHTSLSLCVLKKKNNEFVFFPSIFLPRNEDFYISSQRSVRWKEVGLAKATKEEKKEMTNMTLSTKICAHRHTHTRKMPVSSAKCQYF
jgi:hypothetical protein